MIKPRLLDLFCGAGGASRGYADVGFEVVGVDIYPMPRYPYPFHQGDAIEALVRLLNGGRFSTGHRLADFDVIHASPPCQHYSRMTAARPALADKYPDLIPPTRALLDASGRPYVIENVPGSPLHPDIFLCGQMFGLPLYRHRWFDSNIPLVQPAHPEHVIPGSAAGHWTEGRIISVAGNFAPIDLARRAMGIDWMRRDELAEAIPPAFTRYVGAFLLDQSTPVEWALDYAQIAA